jgi:phosphoglycolate phosphatase
MYKLAVFDLDGTILDTLEDLTSAVKFALENNGLPTRSRDEVRSFVGNGIVNLMKRAAGENAKDGDKVLADFKAYYKAHCAEQTKPYKGILTLLDNLKANGVKLAVLSNKAHFATIALAERYFPEVFDTVAGENEAAGIRKKPAPDALYAIIERYGANKKETVYIGDSEVDIQTAKNAGVDCISVCWGFKDEAFLKTNGASVIVKSPEEILQIFGVK